jgi:hypothetical protein
MMLLWAFARAIEDVMNPLRYLVFYLARGVAATLAQIAVNPDSTIPGRGASAAIALWGTPKGCLINAHQRFADMVSPYCAWPMTIRAGWRHTAARWRGRNFLTFASTGNPLPIDQTLPQVISVRNVRPFIFTIFTRAPPLHSNPAEEQQWLPFEFSVYRRA